VHLQPAYAHLGHEQGDFPAAEAAANSVLSLPLYPELSLRDVEIVAKLVKQNAYVD